ncbi:CLUMA_CG003031, isoform A [Clunio marinus]|uniref:CLUMA_CG003031, isoform A n=1 Tax=Clunio marinus TaxID=568069 RepID=A0A1J1HMH8_9DIPT|nr:CLUMA_CG003031, isoform A [Clunio marinus]
MTLSNKIILGQISLYVFALILTFCLTLPLVLNQYLFDGHCLLFSGGSWQEDDGLLNIAWANKLYCAFPILTGIVTLIIATVQIYRLTKLYHKEEESSFLALFMDAFFSLISCSMILTSAIFITLGFIIWCGLMNERFPSCDTADGQNITKSDVNINTIHFYTHMGIAQFGGWSSFATWVGLSTFAILKLVNNHQLRNLRVSMYLERQRLVNEDNFRENLTEAPRPESSSD